MRLYLQFDSPVAPASEERAREMVKRRGQREPLQQITGSTSFCGLDIAVTRDVLVPRPETELLAEKAWQFLQSLAGGRALDFGTGSGCIAIAMAAKCPAAVITAVDVSPGALELARSTALKLGVEGRVEFVNANGLASLAATGHYDLVVSNPPYIPTGEIETLAPEVRDYEPRVALDGGEDGLAWYRRFAAEGGPLLAAGGRMMLEFGDGQAPAITTIFEQENWVVEQVVEDYTQRPRILMARRE